MQQPQGYPPQQQQQPMYPPPQMMQQAPQAQAGGEEAASHTDCVPLFYYINTDLRDHFYRRVDVLQTASGARSVAEASRRIYE